MVEKRGTDGSDNTSASDETDEGRLDRLEARRQRLDADLLVHRKVVPEASSNKEAAQGYALAVKLSSEFIAGVIVGALLGYLFDQFLGTSPWGLIVFLLLGFCAGVLNVLRSTGAVAQSTPAGRSQTGADAEDDGK
ncbi:hypothetical protein IMCC20628_02852 [Hoeflea sp. IMCC20628]|uniref:AtpZ/AtpI family protein n=1 Tax=Hoeflea sp. IMCC20628 TaxID=1620421 RepID=UPI00063BDBB3|nr:AtpZ/AtpI family protein [Hoeflea sp. IMCC20628]AKI01547.1 hypothetical protein IMCC20628_02852 [Hoeflea sp. IMCC20628]